MNADLAAVFFSLILGISVYWIQGETEVIRLELNTTSEKITQVSVNILGLGELRL